MKRVDPHPLVLVISVLLGIAGTMIVSDPLVALAGWLAIAIVLVLVFVAYIEALVSITYAHKNKKEIALKLDYSFRIGYPVIFLFVIYFFWF